MKEDIKILIRLFSKNIKNTDHLLVIPECLLTFIINSERNTLNKNACYES